MNRRLAQLLEQSGFSQSEVARRMGTNRQRVNLWVLDRAPVPADEIPALADALGVSILSLFGRDEGQLDTTEGRTVRSRPGRLRDDLVAAALERDRQLAPAEREFMEEIASAADRLRQRLRAEEDRP